MVDDMVEDAWAGYMLVVGSVGSAYQGIYPEFTMYSL